MKKLLSVAVAMFALALAAAEREYLWKGVTMPDRQDGQYAAPSQLAKTPGFDKAANAEPYIEWEEPPAADRKTDVCCIIISGGGYSCQCDEPAFRDFGLVKKLLDNGITCVWLWHRVPRPAGLEIYRTAWEDGQRAVRMIRAQAAKRGFDPEKIGMMGCSAGSHLGVMLATSALTPAYAPVDNLDRTPCHINFALLNCPAYAVSDGLTGQNTSGGNAIDVKISDAFRFDDKTCPMCLFHGGSDPYSPIGSTRIYRQLRRMKIPAELHLDAGRVHGAVKGEAFERAIEFLRQLRVLPPLGPEEELMKRYASDADRGGYSKENVWPEGRMPSAQTNQCTPYLEWHHPKSPKTKAIQIIYSGGSYTGNDPHGFEVAPMRRYLNGKGVTVVTMKYRTPRPAGMPKHVTAWQDLQRAVRIVRSKAPALGLDPDRIGIMGSSAGGHLTLMGAFSSMRQAYAPADELDKLSCSVQWGIAIYPAYALTDGAERPNVQGGNEDDSFPVPEFDFDARTCPLVFIHGDADGWAAMNSVKCWERLRRMGIQCDLHTLARREHCFQRKAEPGTGSYTWMDRAWEFLVKKDLVR